MNTVFGDTIEVIDEGHYVRIRVREPLVPGTPKASASLTSEELGAHIRECQRRLDDLNARR